MSEVPKSSLVVNLVAKEELTELNEPLISSAICAELDKAPLKVPVKLVAVTLPLTSKLPVNSCSSFISSPNLVEPLVKIIDDDTNSVLNSCAIISPVTVNEPVMNWSSVKLLLPVVALAPSNVLIDTKFDAISAAMLELVAENEPDISSANCA